MSKFKAGDLVYYPQLGHGIYRLQETGLDVWPLIIRRDYFSKKRFRADGKIFGSDKAATIFHATPEVHEQLERLYGVEFEKPSVKPTSLEIIQAMLNKGEKSVPCWVSDSNEQPNASCPWAYIKMIIKQNDQILFVDEQGVKWKYATPFDPKTDQPITELPE